MADQQEAHPEWTVRQLIEALPSESVLEFFAVLQRAKLALRADLAAAEADAHYAAAARNAEPP